jgi:hypothetical protein
MRFERLGDWLVSCEKKLDLWPKLKFSSGKARRGDLPILRALGRHFLPAASTRISVPV